MQNNGLIYKFGESSNQGFVYIQHNPYSAKRKKIVKKLGVLVTVLSSLNIFVSIAPILKEEVAYAFYSPIYEVKNANEGQEKQYFVNNTTPVAIASKNSIEEVQNETLLNGVNSHFSLVIPKINAKSNIVSNVDAGNEKEYLEALKKGVAHAKGTKLPGDGGTIFLFSHSTNSVWNVNQYSAIFYLLGKLDKGDKIVVFFADKRYEYVVVNKMVTMPTDTSWLTDNSGGEKLILQTCTPPGTNFQRLLVIAKPVNRN